MKVLFVKQPFANLITMKLKGKESRWWQHIQQLQYRGEVLICSSSKAMTPNQVKAVMTPNQWIDFEYLRRKLDYDIYSPTSIAQCVVQLRDFREMAIEDERDSYVHYERGLKVLEFTDVRPVVSFKTFPGMLGLVNCPPAWESQIRFD